MWKKVSEILEATRMKRATYVPLCIMAAASFSKIFHSDLVFLALAGFSIYAIGGLINAKKDNDFNLENTYSYSLIFFLFLSIILSLVNIKIFLLLILAIFLAFIYNSLGRKLLLADLFFMGITHILIPFFGTLWILKSPINSILPFSLLPFFSFIFLINVKNIKGYRKDKELGYKTLMTISKKGKVLMFFSVLLALVFLFYLSLHLNFYLSPLIFTILFLLSLLLLKYIFFLNGDKCLSIARLIIVVILLNFLILNQVPLIWFIFFTIFGFVFINEGIQTILSEYVPRLELKNYS